MKQILRLVTSISSPATLQIALEQLQHVARQKTSGSKLSNSRSVAIAQNAIAQLKVVERRLSKDMAISDAFSAATDPCIVFSNDACLAMTSGARNILGIDEEHPIPSEAVTSLARIANKKANVADAKWTSADGRDFSIEVIQIGSMCILKLHPMASDDFQLDDESMAQKCGLSRKQSKVIALVGEGLMDKAIGERMGCSIHTVRTHLRALAKKLCVTGRIEALLKVRSGMHSPHRQ